MDTNQIIDALGGTSKVAELCHVTAGAVSQWRSNDEIPEPRLMYLRLLRPDVFGENKKRQTTKRKRSPARKSA